MSKSDFVGGLLDAIQEVLPGIGHNKGPAWRPGLETIDLPPGSRAEYVGKGVNRTTEFPRYDPARGTSDRMARLIGAADDPENAIHSLFTNYIEKGRELGGESWYNTEELRNWFIDLYGEKRGDERWRDYIMTVGATSTGSDVPSNLRNASFYFNLNPTDRRAVAELVAQGGITPAEAASKLGLDVPNMPDNYRYGHVMQANHAKNILAQLDGRWDQMIPEGLTGAELTKWLKANPKVKGFYNDLLGSEANIAADKHFMRMLAMSDGGLDFLGQQAQLSGANLEKLRAAYGKAIEPYIQTRKTGTGQMVTQVNLKKAAEDGVIKDTSLFSDIPQAWLDTPNDNEYLALEQMAQRLAANYDMTPAQFQAALWMGAGDITGLADESQGTFMELFRRVLDKRAGERDVSRMGQFMDFAARRSPLALGGLLAAVPGESEAAGAPAPDVSPDDAVARARGYGSYEEMLGEGTIEPRQLTAKEEVSGWLTGLQHGDDWGREEYRRAQNAVEGASWAPLTAPLLDLFQGGKDVQEGRYGSAALNAGLGILDLATMGAGGYLARGASRIPDVLDRVVKNGMVDVPDSPWGRRYFSEQLGAARDSQGAIGRSVDVYEPDGYAGTRMRINPEGDAGYIVKPDGEVASLVKSADSKMRGFAETALRDAEANGGEWLNAFDTALTQMYGRGGYRTASRVPFSEEMARAEWGDEAVDAFMAANSKYNGGRPDLAFMVRDPAGARSVAPGAGGILFQDYGDAVSALESEMRRLGYR